MQQAHMYLFICVWKNDNYLATKSFAGNIVHVLKSTGYISNWIYHSSFVSLSVNCSTTKYVISPSDFAIMIVIVFPLNV